MFANFYDYSKIIGEGSFGKVYIGKHRITKKEVAIKQNTDVPEFLLHESKILRNLQTHRNIPKIIWYGNIDSKPSLIMELLQTSLLDVRKGGIVTNTNLLHNIGGQLVSALEYIHSKNIVHRDIKPENIMFKTNKQDICLIDFGLAKYYKINGEHVDLTKQMDVIGSFNYCSRNMNRGYRPARRDDVESLLYVLLNLSSKLFPCNKNFAGLSIREKNDFLYNFKTSVVNNEASSFVKKIIRVIKHVHVLNYCDDPQYALIKNTLK